MVVAAIAIPWVCGYVLHEVRDFGSNSVPVEAAMVSAITWSMLLVILASAARLESTDLARRRAEHEIAMLSRIDPLTKALNRFAMSEMLDTAWVNFKSSGALSGVLLLDVEYFRRINETFGRQTNGDVLERVASTVQSQLRDHDGVARWNDEEFLIILKIKEHGDLDVVVDRLGTALSDTNGAFCAALDGAPPRISAMFGIGDMREHDKGPADMISRADAGLHAAKEEAGNQVISRYELSDLTDPLVFKDGLDDGPIEADSKDDKKQRPDEIAA
jgi:diguanylate cyclase (GGDEF)-like protein